jgi:hypothetical protein
VPHTHALAAVEQPAKLSNRGRIRFELLGGLDPRNGVTLQQRRHKPSSFGLG